MTSPLTAIRHYYFNVNLGQEPKPIDLVECFMSDDIALHFKFKDENGADISVASASAVMTFSKFNSGNAKIFEITSTGDIALSGNEVTAYLNTEETLQSEGGFKYQLRLTITGKTFVAAYGNINNCALIE